MALVCHVRIVQGIPADKLQPGSRQSIWDTEREIRVAGAVGRETCRRVIADSWSGQDRDSYQGLPDSKQDRESDDGMVLSPFGPKTAHFGLFGDSLCRGGFFLDRNPCLHVAGWESGGIWSF